MNEMLTGQESFEQFNNELTHIITTPLTAETIDVYADKALEDLIMLITKVTESFAHGPTISFDESKSLEEAAFTYYDLDNIENTLSYIADKADELHELDTYIANIREENIVVLPPATNSVNLEVAEEGEHEIDETIPRLKTLLFIVKNEFGVDLEDEGQISIVKGVNHSKMMRKASYYVVELPGLDRLVLINDKTGNATFVLRKEAMENHAISTADIVDVTKTDLTELMDEAPELGKKINYSQLFVKNLVSALDDSLEVSTSSEPYLIQKVPDGYLPVNALAKKYGVSVKTVYGAIDQNADDFGPRVKYRFEKGHITVAYSPDQQQLIHNNLEQRGFLSLAPEGYVTTNDLSLTLGISFGVIYDVTLKLQEELGEVRSYKFQSTVTLGYSPEQQLVIYEYLRDNGKLRSNPPEGYLSFAMLSDKLSDKYSLSDSGLRNIIKDIKEQLGEITKFKTHSRSTEYFSPYQIEVLIEQLEQRGHFEIQRVPEGVLSRNGIAEAIGAGDRAIVNAITELGTSLGEINRYRFGAKLSEGYNALQIELIRAWLEADGYFSDIRPEGYQTVGGIAESFGFSLQSIQNIIHKLEEQGLEQPTTYTSATSTRRRLPYYSPDQVDSIRIQLELDGFFDTMPEGYEHEYGVSLKFGVSNNTIKGVVKMIADAESFGEMKRYKTQARMTIGYSPRQQMLIREELERRGTFMETAPAGYVSLIRFSRNLDLDPKIITRAIHELEDVLSPPVEYRFQSVSTRGFSPADQSFIWAYLEERGHLADKAPAGYISIGALARKYHTDPDKVQEFVISRAADLGEVKQYKVHTTVTAALSEAQQRVLVQEIELWKSLYEDAPRDVLSVKGLLTKFKTSMSTVNRAIAEAGASFGEIKQYRFSNNITYGYSPEQQGIVKKFIERRSHIV